MLPRRAVIAALTLALLAFPLAGSARTELPQPPKAPVADTPGESKAVKKLEWLAFDAAADKAALQNKHLIVDVYTTWCGCCRVRKWRRSCRGFSAQSRLRWQTQG